jgi:cation-transporting ATPase 13A1
LFVVLKVWRGGDWTPVCTEKLVPGDIISLTRGAKGADEVVPCDCLLLHGSAVANEATLTGAFEWRVFILFQILG